jgi:hypothetical protein
MPELEFIASIQTWPQAVALLGVVVTIGATVAWCFYCTWKA